MSQHTEIADPLLENEQIQDPNPFTIPPSSMAYQSMAVTPQGGCGTCGGSGRGRP
jgi:hypothetical protein